MNSTTANCIIEPAVKPPKSGNMTNLPSKILQRPDLALIVTGSLSCVRGIYKTVAALGKLHQFHYCIIDDKDYSSDTWIEKYTNIINNVLTRKGLGGIIIYAGCLDSLAKVNINKVKPHLNNPLNIPVEILFRGPVAAAARKPMELLAEILDRIPTTEGKLEEDGFVLPPLLPDYVGVAAMLKNYNTSNIVLDIGGCSACISPSNSHSFAELKKTTFNGYVGLKNYKENLDDIIAKEAKIENKSSCVLLETPVVKKAELDLTWLKESLKTQGIETISLDTDGYKTSVEGIAEALVKLGQHAKQLFQSKPLTTVPNLIGILGADSGQSAFQEKIHHGIEHFTKDGYEALFPEELSWETMDKLATVRINWVVSSVAIPLAQYMKKEFGIPFFGALPIGARAMFLWRNQVNKMMHNTNAQPLEIPAVAPPAIKQKKVLIVGDPILTAGIKRYFIAMEGYQKVDRAVYTPIPSFAEFCTAVTTDEYTRGLEDDIIQIKDAPLQINDTKAWLDLASHYDIIVCDKLMQLCTGAKLSPELWINIPDGILSSGLVEEEDYTIFGKKGAAWLRKAQNIETDEPRMM